MPGMFFLETQCSTNNANAIEWAEGKQCNFNSLFHFYDSSKKSYVEE